MLDNSLNVAEDSGTETSVQLPMSVVAKKLAEIRDNRDALIARHGPVGQLPSKKAAKRQKRRPKLKFNDGFFEFERELLDHPTFKHTGPASKERALLELKAFAQFKAGHVTLWDGERVWLEEGQFCHTESYLAERWNWSRSAVTRFLKSLEKAYEVDSGHQTEQDPHTKPNKALCRFEPVITQRVVGNKKIITVCSKYKKSNQQDMAEQPVEAQNRTPLITKPNKALYETEHKNKESLKKKDWGCPR